MRTVRVSSAQSMMGNRGIRVPTRTTAVKKRYLASCFGLTAQLHEVGGQAAVKVKTRHVGQNHRRHQQAD